MQWEPIIAASVTGVLALVGIVWQSRKTRRVNTFEHMQNSGKLDTIETKMDRIDYRVERVQDRLEDHLEAHRRFTDPPSNP